jgi:1-acyl-sn-glycerol-3-phosphate acyltransferase
MITDIIYKCPKCGVMDWCKDGKCISCGVTLELISRTRVSISGEIRPVGDWYDSVLSFDINIPESGPVLKSKKIRLSEESTKGIYTGYAGIVSTHYVRKPIGDGRLELFADRLEFIGDSIQSRTLGIEDMLAVTIESDTLQIVSHEYGPLFFDFLEESGKKWEDCLRRIIKDHYSEDIIEFCPRIRKRGWLERPRPAAGHEKLRVPVRTWRRAEHPLLFVFAKLLMKLVLSAAFKIRVEGIENIPKSGPVVMLPNHCSFLDSIILVPFSPRKIWFMAKNSEYKSGIHKFLMGIAGSFPVRRYTTDFQAVRNAVRVVQDGHVLGIFPEGERCWDNRLLPYKIGTIRLILALGLDVIPVGVSGAYALMPRWTHDIKRVPITIRIGKPINLGHIPAPKQTMNDIQVASQRLKVAMTALIGEGS